MVAIILFLSLDFSAFHSSMYLLLCFGFSYSIMITSSNCFQLPKSDDMRKLECSFLNP